MPQTNPIIYIKYHAENAGPVQQAHAGEWFDLRSAYDVNLKPGDFAFIDLGVSIQVPSGYEAILTPRSSTFKNYGIIQTNSIGVIDETYSGEEDVWKMPVYATRKIHIPAGTRIAQFRIQPNQGSPAVEVMAEMTGPNRGGFGSTGTN